ncbi:LXG domain-containing protein [Bacillus sp. MUM 13]|uniref:ribonuclease YeeF family protein n=1 Tax=Bacillus sp. MUM 13 TaxID=1678001 RepID=UPI0008F5A408|nr:LXG domain-containing protein [Bacillus sp. MUM 13]OIK13884.1 hypothetical protein BIV59_04240 [Bacillus sp. MUM 13]
MKVLNAQSFHEGIKRYQTMLDTIGKDVHSIEQAIKTFSDLDESFKGKGGETILSFYRSCHLPLLSYFSSFITSFAEVLRKMESALNSFDPNNAAFIREEFLKGEVENGLTTFSQKTGELTDETNYSMTAVSDIVSLPSLEDSYVQQEIQSAKKQRDQTITQLNEFDHDQKGALTKLADDLAKMNSWLSDIQGMMKDGLTDVNFPADVWAAYAVIAPLNADVKKKDEKGMTMKEKVGWAKRANSIATNGAASFRLFLAGKNGGLSIIKMKDPKTGKFLYRLNATEEALKKLGVKPEPNGQAWKELMRGLPKDPKKWTVKQEQIAAARMATLKFFTKKSGSNGWSAAGNEALKKASALGYYNNKASLAEKGKTVGKAAFKGAGKSFTDIVDFKGIYKSGVLKGAGKALAPVGAALSYKSNFDTAKEEGLDDGGAALRAAQDTAIDTAVGGAIQTGFTAAGTALIPIPGVGTAIGFGVGMAVNYFINQKDEKSGKSIMDRVKGWFH